MQKRMRGAHPRTPGGRFADGSSSNKGESGGNSKFTPPRAPKPKLQKPVKPEAPTSEKPAE